MLTARNAKEIHQLMAVLYLIEKWEILIFSFNGNDLEKTVFKLNPQVLTIVKAYCSERLFQ